MVAGIIIGVLVLLWVVASFFVYRMTFFVPRSTQTDPFLFPKSEQYRPYEALNRKRVESLMALPYEDLYVKSYDGLRLHARFYNFHGDKAPVGICVHGWRGCCYRDFSGGTFALQKMGYNVLLIDQRGHGESEGHTLTFGVKERKDVKNWVDFLIARFGEQTQVFLYGISMGAATVLLASGMDLPTNVKGIVADCPYASPKEIILEVMRKDHPTPVWIGYPLVWSAALLFAHFRLSNFSAVDEVQKSKPPILIIHGDDDRFVPCEMSEKVAKANSSIQREVFPTAGHGISYLVDPERYDRIVHDFTKKCLEGDVQHED